MAEVETDYLNIAPDLPFHKTLQVGTDVHVDVTELGWVIGVERVGGPVDVATLAAVLRTLRVLR